MATNSTASPTEGQNPKRVDFSTDAIQTKSGDEARPSSRQWISHSKKNQTNLDEVIVDTRARRHAAIFQRPHAVLFETHDDSNESGVAITSRTSSNTSSQKDAKDSEERSTGNVAKQLRRLDLFVDVLWVGIIANLSGTFGEQAFSNSGVRTSSAVIEFILLFLPIWRIWDHLRSYTTQFYLE